MDVRENWFLGALEGDDLRRIQSQLTPMPFDLGQVLCEPGEEMTHVFFYRAGMSSDICVLEDGFEVEAAGFGHQSAYGLGAAFPGAVSFTRNICQVAGDGWRLPASVFRDALSQSIPLHTLVLTHVQALLGVMARSVACNARHGLDLRLARWLLTAGDHSPGDAVHTTHEFLAVMTGVQRTTVTEELGAMQEQGLVELGRGRVMLADRGRLERRACECYAATVQAWERLRPGSQERPLAGV